MRYVAPPAEDLLPTAEPACVFTTWEGVAQCAIDRLDSLRQANADKARVRGWVSNRAGRNVAETRNSAAGP